MARQGTTPILTLSIPVIRDEDDQIVPSSLLDGCNVYVTIDQDGTQITKASRTSPDIEIRKVYDEDIPDRHIATAVAVYLQQSETLGFEVGKARVQIRWVDFLGNAFATDIQSFRIDESLLDDVIDYGD